MQTMYAAGLLLLSENSARPFTLYCLCRKCSEILGIYQNLGRICWYFLLEHPPQFNRSEICR